MAKAESKSTTRRAVLAGIAAAPALTVPAIAHAALLIGPSHSDAALFALEQQLDVAERDAKVALKAYTRVENIMIAWRRQNPAPRMRVCSVSIEGSPRNLVELARIMQPMLADVV